MLSERGALVLSACAAALLAAIGVAAALATGSGAILLDGLFNLCFCVTALFTLRVARLLARPDDERYPFGYLFFEPLINTVKGLLILGVSAFALFDAAIALASGGRAVEFGPAALYAAFATLACLAVVWALRRAAPSPLVAADVDTWTVNAAVSGGVLLGFLLAAGLERWGHAGAALYVDPAMVALVVLLSIALPVRMAATGLLALLNRAPARRGGGRHGGPRPRRPRRPAASPASGSARSSPDAPPTWSCTCWCRPAPTSTSPPPTACAAR